MRVKTWSQAWKQAAKDWRRIAIRRGIKHRTRTEQDQFIREQWYHIRTLCNKARRVANALERQEAPEKIERALRELKQTEKFTREYMGNYLLPWEDR